MAHRAPHAADFGIDERNLAIRRSFIRLGPREQDLLRPLVPWIESVSADLAVEFFDWQFSFPPTAELLAGHAEASGLPLQRLRAHLEVAQAAYIEGVFRGAVKGWDLAYFGDRLHIGTVHGRIDLPFKWYVGSYCLWRDLLTERLLQHFADEDDGEAMVLRVMGAVEKVFNLDVQAIGDAFVMATLESMGFSVSGITPDPGKDRTEHLGQLEDQMAVLTNGAAVSVSEVDAALESVSAATEQP